MRMGYERIVKVQVELNVLWENVWLVPWAL